MGYKQRFLQGITPDITGITFEVMGQKKDISSPSINDINSRYPVEIQEEEFQYALKVSAYDFQ